MTHPVADERPAAAHGDALNLLRAAIAEAPGPQAAAQRGVELLHERLGRYDWIGVYWADGSELALGPWTGPSAAEHDRLPIGSQESELVVPIFDGGHLVGEIHVDGSDLNLHDDTDARFLEEVAALFAPLRPRA